jgi:branched-chain amino acid transport system substrate-binding protein
VLVDCVGLARGFRDATMSGVELPLLQRGATLRGARPGDGVGSATVAGRKVELVTGCTEGGEYSVLIEQARRLVEVDKVDVLVGGTWAGDGLVLREVAGRHPTTAFVATAPGAREVTLRDPPANLFRFGGDFSQQAAGLGTYAFRDLGWREAAVVVDDNEVGWGEAAAFLAEFCALGGRATQLLMPFFGSTGPAPATPPSADGVALFGNPFSLPPDKAVASAGGRTPLTSKLLLGPYYALYPDVVRALPAALNGVVTSVPAPGDGAAHRQYLAAYATHFPALAETQPMQPYVSIYRDAVEAVLAALERSGGSVGADGAALRQALAAADVTTLVSGRIRMDGNRAAVISNGLVRLGPNGTQELIRTVNDVDQTLGGTLPSTYEPFSGEQPCQAGTLPPWAR